MIGQHLPFRICCTSGVTTLVLGTRRFILKRLKVGASRINFRMRSRSSSSYRPFNLINLTEPHPPFHVQFNRASILLMKALCSCSPSPGIFVPHYLFFFGFLLKSIFSCFPCKVVMSSSIVSLCDFSFSKYLFHGVYRGRRTFW